MALPWATTLGMVVLVVHMVVLGVHMVVVLGDHMVVLGDCMVVEGCTVTACIGEVMVGLMDLLACMVV